jgi:hypothetical protein
MPGQQNKKVGVDYGNYTLHYLYWFSDQNDANAFDELGWIESEVINGDDKDIWLILNENRKDITMIVPHLGAINSSSTKYANLRITNLSGDPVQIYANDKLIESVCYLEDGSPQNLSTLDRNGDYTFIMPIYEEGAMQDDFVLVAKHLTNGTTVETAIITVFAEETVNWIVDGKEDVGDEPADEVIQDPAE